MRFLIGSPFSTFILGPEVGDIILMKELPLDAWGKMKDSWSKDAGR